MLCWIETRKERAAAWRTHGAVAEGVSKAEAMLNQALAVGQIRFRPSLRPMLRLAFLVGEDNQQIGTLRQRGLAVRRNRLWLGITPRRYTRNQQRTRSAQKSPAG